MLMDSCSEYYNRASEIGFTLEIDSIKAATSYYTVKAWKVNSKAKIPKPEFNYRFGQFDKLIVFLDQWIEGKKIEQQRKEQKKQAKKDAAKESHPYTEGMIIYNSWGFEQTNIDFYKIVKVKNKTLTLRKISSRPADKQPSKNMVMCAMVVPVDNLEGKEFTKRVQIHIWSDNTVHHTIPCKYGVMRIYNEGDVGVYQSWYA